MIRTSIDSNINWDFEPDGCEGAAQPWLGTDVLVCGGGPAGACAAIAAARNGASVLLVERGNCLGGMATQALVGPFMTCYDKS